MQLDTDQFVEAVLKWFNERYNRKVGDPLTKELIAKVHQRLQPTLLDTQSIFKMKAKQWLGDPKMHQYFHPRSLFRMSNFRRYLAELEDEQNQFDPISEEIIEHFNKVTGVNFLIVPQYLCVIAPLSERLGADVVKKVIDYMVPKLKTYNNKFVLMPEYFFAHKNFYRFYNEYLLAGDDKKQEDECPVCARGVWNENQMHTWCRNHTEEWMDR